MLKGSKNELGITADGIIGAIIGDMAGAPFEHSQHKSTEFELLGRHSRFTDDTVMTVAVADWLLHGGALPEIMRRWGRRYPYSGYGGMFRRWLFNDRDPAAQLPYNSFGNGSAMRVSPVGYWGGSLDEVLDLARQTAEVSHNHPEGIKGAQAIASSVYLACAGNTHEEIRTFVEERFGYDLHRTCDDIRPLYRFDSSCQGSCPEAIIAFLDSTDYESALRLAVSLGGDSDTLACMAGAIAGACYGVPQAIVEKARTLLPDDILSIVDEFDDHFLLKKP